MSPSGGVRLGVRGRPEMVILDPQHGLDGLVVHSAVDLPCVRRERHMPDAERLVGGSYIELKGVLGNIDFIKYVGSRRSRGSRGTGGVGRWNVFFGLRFVLARGIRAIVHVR